MSNYSFLKTIMEIAGYSQYEIEDALQKINDDPNEYFALLKALEAAEELKRTDKPAQNENY